MEDLEQIYDEALESIEKVERDGPSNMVDKWERALDHALRAMDTTGRKAIRTVEHTVYEEVITRFAPYYFDNELVSANLRRTGRLEDSGEFVLEVNVNDDELKAAVSRELEAVDGAD